MLSALQTACLHPVSSMAAALVVRCGPGQHLRPVRNRARSVRRAAARRHGLAQNTKTGLAPATTDDEGRYHFIALPVVGEYSVKIELAGFGAEERAGLVFQANTKPVSFTLKVATLAEASPSWRRADSRDAQGGAQPDRRPAEDRDHAAQRQELSRPGELRQASIGAATRGDLSVNGQLGRNIDYVVDGVSNKVIEWGDASKTGLSLDIIQEFQVITSQFSAEFGHSLGGVVTAVTRSGTNEFHGTGYFYHRPGALDAKNRLTGTRTPFNQKQFGGLLSGPVFKDRIHFIGSFEGTNQDSQLVVTSALQPGAFPATLNRNQGFAKVTHQLANNHNAQLRFNYDNQNTIGGFGGLALPDGGTKSKRESWELQGTMTSVLSSRMVNEARFQFSRFVNESTNLTGAAQRLHRPRHVRRQPGQAAGHPREPHPVHRQAVPRLRRAPDVRRRRHVAHCEDRRVQRQLRRRLHLLRRHAYPFNARNPATFPARFEQGFADPRRPISLHRDFAPFDFAGIDRQYLELSSSRRTTGKCARVHAESRARYEKQTSSPDNNNIMPRTGFAWDLNRDGRTVVRGGYGRFYDQLFDNIPNTEDLFGIVGNYSITLTPTGNPGIFPVFPNVLAAPPSSLGIPTGRTATLDLRGGPGRAEDAVQRPGHDWRRA